MSGFVATAPASPAQPLSSGGWYPDIDPTEARAVMRLDGTVTNDRLVECLSNAMSSVEDELDEWQQQQRALGRARLADVPSKAINGVSRLVMLYKRAVVAYAQAELLEKYRELDTTGRGDRRADAMNETAEDYRRNVRYAVRDILGRPRATVELI